MNRDPNKKDEKISQSKSDEQTVSDDKNKNESRDEKLDPTHFGDWQVNCRTVDF